MNLSPPSSSSRPKLATAKRWTGRPTGPWVTARKIVQYLALLLFVGLFVAARNAIQAGSAAPGLLNFPLRLNPLVTLSHLLASRTFLAGSALALLIVILTLILGRAWCGWLCPLGTVLDLFPLRKRNARPAAIPENWRSLKYGLLLTILVAAFFGNLSLLILDPLTILYRSLTLSLWPALDRIITPLERALIQVPALEEAVVRFDSWVRPALLPATPVYSREALLFGLVFVGVVALNLAAPRFWCRYLCPLGGLLGMLSKLAIFRRHAGEECKGCTLCTQVCPTGTIDPARGYASDPAECTLCLDCLETCPRSFISVTPGLSLAEWRDYDPGRRQALAALGVAAGGVALLGSDLNSFRPHPRLLRPPGAFEDEILSRCVRCGECLRACPTSGLQPALSEAGLGGLWTPVLVPRLGYCDYACNACGQICPVEAIPHLQLEEKRVQEIGKAYLDTSRCIAWADHRECIVCEEMCPLPEKAIYLQESEVLDASGEPFILQLPFVDRERCIGCGICEYRCPINGDSAIQVFIAGLAEPF